MTEQWSMYGSSSASCKAKNEIRRLILVRTGQYMKAWSRSQVLSTWKLPGSPGPMDLSRQSLCQDLRRRLLDKDATNRYSANGMEGNE